MIAAPKTPAELLWEITSFTGLHICVVSQVLGVSERTAELWLTAIIKPEKSNRQFIALLHLAAQQGGQEFGHKLNVGIWGTNAPFVGSWLLITQTAAQAGA